MGDGGGRVVILHRGHEFGRLLAVPCVSQKFIHVDQSRARKDALVTDVPVPRLKEAQQFDLQLSLGSEIGVAALAGKNVMPAAIPEQPSFAEPGSRSNYRLIAGGPAHTVQWDQIRFRERSNSPSAGFEIVNEKSCRKMNLFGEPRLLYDPGKVRSLHPPVAHRARNSKTGSFRLRAGVIQETADDRQVRCARGWETRAPTPVADVRSVVENKPASHWYHQYRRPESFLEVPPTAPVPFQQFLGLLRSPGARGIVGEIARGQRVPKIKHRIHYGPACLHHVRALE